MRIKVLIGSTMIGFASQAAAISLGDIQIDAVLDGLKAVTLSNEDVIALSRQSIQQYDAQHTVASPESEHGARLYGLTLDHGVEDGLELNFKVYMNESVNAFAMADGSIRFFSGLMDRMTNEEILFVVGHEIGHVKLEHSKNQMKTAFATSAARKSAAAAGGDLGSIAASQLGGLAEAMLHASFSRKEETAADEYSVEFMMRHGYNPESAVSALLVLADLGDSADFLSSHPKPSKRVKNIRKKYDL